MHATRQSPIDDADLEDIVVYADEDSKKGRMAQVSQHINLHCSPMCWTPFH